MSSASSSRIARRLQERQQSLSVKTLQNAESRAVFAMAGLFRSNPARRLDPAGLLSRPSFDEAFMLAMPRIVSAYENFDVLSFKAALADEAATSCFAGELSGSSVEGKADLFAVVLRGSLEAMEDFVQNPDAFSDFARTFRAAGLAHLRSSVVLCPLLISPEAAGSAFPGQVRALAEILQMPLQDPDFPLSSAVSDLLAAHRTVPLSSTGLETRLVVGARVRVVASREPVDEDGLSPRSLASLNEAPDWTRRAAAVLKTGVETSLPMSWNRACSRMAADELLAALVLRAHALGMDMTGRFDAVHVCETEDRLLVSATRGMIAVGPASTSATAAYADPAWFGEFLASLADSVHQKTAAGLMPQG